MKTYKFKFSKLITVLIYVGIALSVVGLGLNIYFISSDGLANAVKIIYPILQYSLMFLVCILLLVILLSLLISSYYSIDGTTLKTSFGIIKTKYDISKIERIELDKTSKKLTVFFSEEQFTVIVINSDWHEDFVGSLLKVNPKIEFLLHSEEPDEKDKK